MTHNEIFITAYSLPALGMIFCCLDFVRGFLEGAINGKRDIHDRPGHGVLFRNRAFKADGNITGTMDFNRFKRTDGIDLNKPTGRGCNPLPGHAPNNSRGSYMNFTLNSKAILSGIGYETDQHIKNSLTMDNPKYKDLVKLGKYTGNTPERLEFYENKSCGLVIPRGFAARAYQICQEHGELVNVIDNRLIFGVVEFNFQGSLKPFQTVAVKDMLLHDSGVLSSGTGSGKTVMALYLIAERKQPTLIIVHTKELLNQWIDRIEQFLGIPADEVGIIGAGKFTLGDRITVGMVQTLCKRVDEVKGLFGHVIVDECHRCPSKTFSDVVTSFDAKYLLGLSATAYRRDGLGRVIYLYLGDKRHEVKKAELLDLGPPLPSSSHLA